MFENDRAAAEPKVNMGSETLHLQSPQGLGIFKVLTPCVHKKSISHSIAIRMSLPSYYGTSRVVQDHYLSNLYKTE